MLLISTEVVGSRQVWVRRRSEMVRVAASDGPTERDLLAVVETDWVLLTMAGRPAKVPPEIARYFAPTRPFTRDRILLPEATEAVTRLSTRVRPLDVDPMRHMNNAAYLDMIDDALGTATCRREPSAGRSAIASATSHRPCRARPSRSRAGP